MAGGDDVVEGRATDASHRIRSAAAATIRDLVRSPRTVNRAVVAFGELAATEPTY